MQVLKESFKIYCAINDGIINLVEMVNFYSRLLFPLGLINCVFPPTFFPPLT